MRLFEPVDNFELSGATLFAVAASAAQFGVMLFASIYPPCCFRIFVKKCVIVELEYSRHIDAFGTGHAGTARIAGNSTPLEIFIPHPIDQQLFLNSQAVQFHAIRNIGALDQILD